MLQIGQYQSITDLRFKTKELLAKAETEPVLLLHHSTPKGVLLSYAQYLNLLDMVEDYQLSLRAQEYVTRPKKQTDWVSLKDVKKKLKIS